MFPSLVIHIIVLFLVVDPIHTTDLFSSIQIAIYGLNKKGGDVSSNYLVNPVRCKDAIVKSRIVCGGVSLNKRQEGPCTIG